MKTTFYTEDILRLKIFSHNMHEDFILSCYPISKGAKIIMYTFIMKQIKSRGLGIHLLEINIK